MEPYVFVWARPDNGEVAQLPRAGRPKKNWMFGEAYLDYAYAAMSLLQFFLNTFKT